MACLKDLLFVLGIAITGFGLVLIVIGLFIRFVIAPFKNKNPPTGF